MTPQEFVMETSPRHSKNRLKMVRPRSEISTFANGSASGKVAAGTRHLRLRVTAPQANWLIIHEVTIQ